MWSYNKTTELFHYGRKGMKWYQNVFTKDKLKRNVGGAFTRRSLEAAKNLTDAGRTINSALARGKAAKKGFNLDQMSDDELRKRVNRLNMERQYKSLMSEDVGRGHDRVDRILAIAGGVLAAGASAATIALSIKQFRAKAGE